MGLPPVSQTWTYSLNNLHTFDTTIGTTGALMFALAGSGGFLPSTMGYTVKGSSNGTTAAMDGTNRILSASNWATRSTVAAGAMSWIVLTDGAGIDWCFSFFSASDDIVRLAHSPGGNYVAAATATQQPTATDECFDVASGTWVGTDLTHRRIYDFWASSDKKIFRFATFFNTTLASFIKGEKFTTALVSPATHTLANGGGTQGAIKSYYNGNNSNTTVNNTYQATLCSDLCRVHAAGQDINSQATIGGVMPGGGTGYESGSIGSFNVDTPALQGGNGELLFPSQLGANTISADGKLGTVFDQWYTIGVNNATPSLGDTYGTLQFFVVSMGGGIIVPLDGVTTPIVV